MILYQDKEIVVCIKEPGVLSQQGRPGERNMVDILSQQCGGSIYPVHRLDKQVGGVMVYARTKASAAALSSQITSMKMEKTYIAETTTPLPLRQGTMEDLLFFDKQRNKSFVVKRERKGVKKALLEYEEIGSSHARTAYRVRLITGRTHQIRVQFASRKSPLAGDRKYGSEEKGEIGLYCCGLRFYHPVTGEEMSFNAQKQENK